MEPITYTLSTGSELAVYRTATYGDIAVLGAVLILVLFVFFSGVFSMTSRRRKL